MKRLIFGRPESAAVYPGRKQIEIEVRRLAIPQSSPRKMALYLIH
jgi:hypothetical protein